MSYRTMRKLVSTASAAARPLFPARFYLGNRCLRRPTSCIPAVVLQPWRRAHLASRDGGNAKGLLAAAAHACARGIRASVHVRTIRAMPGSDSKCRRNEWISQD
jgi:hypothetical protein